MARRGQGSSEELPNGRMGHYVSHLEPGVHLATSSKTVLTEKSDESSVFDEYTRKHKWNKKYGNAIKNLIPIRNTKWRKDHTLPSSRVGCLSFVSSSWLTPLMWKAYRKGMSPEDVWDLHEMDSAKRNAARLEHIWQEEIQSKGLANASLNRAVWRFARTRVFLAIVLVILTNIFQFLGPAWVQNELLNFVENYSAPESWGLILVAVLFVSQCMRNICFNSMWIIGYHTAIRVMGSLQYIIYKKLLRIQSPNDRILGKVVNMCTNDQERLCEAIAAGVLMIGAPAIALMSMVYSCMILGPWALVGNFILIAFTPMSMGIAKLTNKIRLKTVRLSDQRVSLTNTVLNNIRLIKMYAWENSFFQKIIDIRHQEHKQLKLASVLQSIGTTLTPTSATLASVATFLGYTLAGNNLRPTDAFAIFSIFNAVLFSMGRLPYAVRCVGEAKVCLNRVKEYLAIPEFDSQIDRSGMAHTLAVELKNATFAWEVPQDDLKKLKLKGKGKHNIVSPAKDSSRLLATVLHDINLKVQQGTLLGICGGVGSGKSSILSALIGELKLQHGNMKVNGKVAYVTQQAWIFNETLQENILFGLPYNEQRYKATINVCGLKRDLELLSNGDMTEIGENGFNLSGGQKQRISLARAVYSDRDIYLLDDPLSAVDANVASYIYHNCIHGPNALLSGKTIIMVTHNTMALEGCDRLIVVKDGAILEEGTPAELAKLEGGDYSSLLNELSRETCSPISDTLVKKTECPATEELSNPENHCDYMQESEKTTVLNSVKHPFRKYLVMCGGYCISLIAASAMILFALVRLFNALWLQTWLDAGDGSDFLLLDPNSAKNNFSWNENDTLEYLVHNNGSSIVSLKKEDFGSVKDNPEQWLYQSVYGASVIALMICCILKAYADMSLLLQGSKRIHDQLLDKVLRKPVKFFDQIQSGRLLNLFSKDMDEVDVRFPYFTDAVWQGLALVVSQLLLVCVLLPYFTGPVIILAAIFLLMDVWLNKAVSQTKRTASDLQSPVVNFLSSTVSGMSLIRTFDRQEVFQERFNKHVNKHLAGEIIFRLATCWFTFRMDLLAMIAVVVTALITVLTRGTVTAAEAGNALSCIFTVAAFISTFMRLKSEMQARFTSVERIFEYMQGPVEEDNGSVIPPPSWPEKGSVKLDNVCLRYSPEKPLVLRNISLEINPGEKIGIVGRTGAGKTSLIATLMRLVELDSGQVEIDGVDISQIGLTQLRAAIAVIPQDPVLFAGTIRYNLDPFEEHSDETLWDVLEKSHLKEKVQKDEKGLSMIVEADGDNFSVGEKQLMCLGRALLRRNKILLLDEATASVDLMTDRLIQLTLSEAFSHCTLLTIAHRLDTILTYDRIVVMDAGMVVESDRPEVLRETEGSVFRGMLEAMGIQSSK